MDNKKYLSGVSDHVVDLEKHGAISKDTVTICMAIISIGAIIIDLHEKDD